MKKLIAGACLMTVVFGCDAPGNRMIPTDVQKRNMLEEKFSTKEVFCIPNMSYRYVVRLSNGEVLYVETNLIGESSYYTIFPSDPSKPAPIIKKSDE